MIRAEIAALDAIGLAVQINALCDRYGLRGRVRAPKVRPPNPTRAMVFRGTTKVCVTCGATFPVETRSDCRAKKCPAHRERMRGGPRVRPRPQKAAPVAPLKVAPALKPKPVPAPTHCPCGAPLTPLRTINGLCLECAPLDARRAS